MYSLGIDIGTSSVKVSLLDIGTGACVASSTNPEKEAPIISLRKGWAEQNPESWWKYLCDGIRHIASTHNLKDVTTIGITYQMHGLVCLDKDGRPVRNAIIWCDSRAVDIGAEALEGIGYDRCMLELLNSPGNFTASKLAWVRRNEPGLYAETKVFMLPGDYIAYKFSGDITTTGTGLSEGILWDFSHNRRADFVAEYFGIGSDKFARVVPSIGEQCRTSGEIESLLGIPKGTPVCYRAGDQPNNAFSLNVLNPGEVAATAGTSGVVYGVTDLPKADSRSRVNTFLHVNHTAEAPRLGVLLCINGTGIMYSWMRRNFGTGLSYPQMNELAEDAPAGSDGLTVIPFGNGAERVLCNRIVGSGICGLDLVRHSTPHLLRATQEGIAFSFLYGIRIMKSLGLDLRVIRAGDANLFKSRLFCRTLSTLCGSSIELYNTDGSLGAARGAALGAGFYRSPEEAFANLDTVARVTPEISWKSPLEDAYGRWTDELNKAITQ
ncbi:MAG: carbohydrate kinase [Bacteroidales bacterium]|nr:carbohydrate kinase [Bacteroidales bacterium]